MDDLYPLTGIPIPSTPAYRISGQLDYVTATKSIRFNDFEGVVGNSDCRGHHRRGAAGAKSPT